MATIRENRLFLGNPGTGKSTLINCLLGANHMTSGLSWGGGLSQGYQCFEKDGIAYMDAPGLADETIQEQAAQAITKALKQSGNYKLFFLVRLQNGRVMSEDLVTLERVLDSIDAGDLNYKFTIVINCIGDRQYKALVARGDEFKKIKTLINRKYLTESFCFIARVQALEEQSNAVVELPREVRAFLDRKAPVIAVETRQVKAIVVAGFAQQNQEIKREIEKLRNDQAALLRTMKEQEKRHDETMQRMRANHAIELDQLRKGGINPHPAAALSPRSNHDFAAIPLTPPIAPMNEPGPSGFSRCKKLIALLVAMAILVAVVVAVVVATQTTNKEPSPTPRPLPTPTPIPTLTPTPTSSESSPVTKTPTNALSKVTKFLGCLTSEDMLSADRLLYGGASATNYNVALAQAETTSKKYIAIARLNATMGYAFVFDKLLKDASSFDGNDAGCKLACPDSREFYCGCGDDVCKSVGVKPGLRQTLYRRWAVYERQSV